MKYIPRPSFWKCAWTRYFTKNAENVFQSFNISFFQEKRASKPYDLPILISLVYEKSLATALLLGKLQVLTKLRKSQTEYNILVSFWFSLISVWNFSFEQ